MFNGSYLRACMKLRIVQKIRFSLHESGWTMAWCPGLVSRPSAKAQEPLARSRGQWQEVEGLLFSPKNSQLAHILSFRSYLRTCMKLRIVQKIRFSLHESGRTKPWCRGLVFGLIAKAQEFVVRIRGLVIQPPKLSVGAYFELSFLGCGFLIHLSNRSDSPRFRAPWKKIRQKYGTRQEPSLFKGIHCPASMQMHYVQ